MAKAFRIFLSIIVGLIASQYTIFMPNRQLSFDCPSGCSSTYGFPVEALRLDSNAFSSSFSINNPIGFVIDFGIILISIFLFYISLSRLQRNMTKWGKLTSNIIALLIIVVIFILLLIYRIGYQSASTSTLSLFVSPKTHLVL